MTGAADSPAAPIIVRGRHLLLGVDAQDRVEAVRDGAILCIDGKIAQIGPWEEIRAANPDVTVLGDGDALVIPGLVDAHHHIGMTPIQLGSPDLPLELWLTHQWRARAVPPYLDALVSGFEHVASGVTAVQHLGRMRPAPVSAWPDEAGEVIRAYRDLGLRVSYAFCNRDQNRLVYEDDEIFVDSLPEALRDRTRAHLAPHHFRLEEFESDYLKPMVDRFGAARDPLVRLWLAPINMERASDALLRKTSQWAATYGMGIHLHLSETVYQKEYATRRFGKSAVAHLAEIGFLGPHVTLGHGTWCDAHDMDLIHASGCCICHNASSNLRLRSGIAPVTEYVARGIPVALGIDEAGLNDDRDMLQEMRLVKHLHCVPGLEATALTPAQIFRMATETGARAIGFGDEIGRLAPGRRADMVVLDWPAMTHPFTEPAMPPEAVLIHRAKTEHVRATVIDGRIVYRDGSPCHVDRAATLSAVAEAMAAPQPDSAIARGDLSDALLPYIRAFYDGWPLPEGPAWYVLNGR
ncbi:amidohydrolase family protein [Roseisalinus antarcticus]|uniref:Atrazine chlorohydrolase n=1 Tax=Roseisalinus antarcticus TaxID=254357 RepID=A0A1Y5T5T5_9RHOB|nr:amidohydrolase family protein [Roseisalinus antarcticus]SLN56469.1 Atrazine chlorohydrolase [Roseisalinus antarcticus]